MKGRNLQQFDNLNARARHHFFADYVILARKVCSTNSLLAKDIACVQILDVDFSNSLIIY